MTKAEAVQIASTITGPYREMWRQVFRVLDPKKTVLVDPANGDIHLGPADHFEEDGEN